jgi:two-component system sensor histidine kinase KdpD
MSIVTRAVPVAISLTVVAATTAILWYVRLTALSLRDPVFFYVLPIIIVAIVYGRGPALLGACAAFFCADYFLYEPFYSFDITSRVEVGDLTCFAVLALIGIKCVGELFRPSAAQATAATALSRPLASAARVRPAAVIRTGMRAD